MARQSEGSPPPYPGEKEAPGSDRPPAVETSGRVMSAKPRRASAADVTLRRKTMSYRFTIALSFGALAAFASLPTAVHAGSGGKGSSTIRDVECAMYDGYGVRIFGTGITQVSADELSAKLTCKARNVPTPGGGTIYYNFANTGHGCQVIGQFTNDWEEALTDRGVATMTCKLVIQ